ncbi:MAG: STN domain-containing protein [Planctomycetes bacterium]|nr:STN domain-containing protein [Planctomycetota bacterium]
MLLGCACLVVLGVIAGAAVGAVWPAAEQALQRKVAHHEASGSLGAVLADFAGRAGVSLQVDWPALAKVGIERKQPVSVNLRNVTYRQVLERILALAGRGRPLAWRAVDGRVVVSTQGEIMRMQRLAQQRGRGGAAGGPSAPVRSKLARRVLPLVKFDNLPLRDALKFFASATGANFHVNWRALQAGGITPETPVSLDLRRVTVWRALDLVLDEINADRSKLDSVYWVIDRGVVLITTGNDLNRDVVTRVVDVGGVLLLRPDFPGPRMDLQNATESASATGETSSGTTDDLWVDTDRQQNRQGKSYDDKKKEKQEKLIETIKTMIGPEMWQPEGKGSIRIINKKLVISQTRLGFKLLEKALR